MYAMKAASWSLALVVAVGSALAKEEDCTDDPVPVYESSSYVAAYESSSAPAAHPSVWASSSIPVIPASESYPAGKPSGPVIVTNTKTLTKTVCPCTDPTRTPGEVYVTETTTEYTTTCPGTGETKTFTYGDWTSVYTSYEISTLTDTYTVTVTEPYPVGSEPAGYPSGSVPASPSGPAGYPSGSAPAGYPSGLSGAWPSGSAPAYSSGPAGYPSGSSPPYPYPSGHPSSSAYPSSFGPTGTAPSSPTGTSCIPCQGQPGNNPEEWCGYTIHDNWYKVTPKTCKTREYFFSITEETVSPDGIARPAFLVNGQMPGPMIEANWGDTIVVHLTNNMPLTAFNGSSLHFHGIRQNGTNEMDGVPSITQCPVGPGSSMTYKWVANSYGTSWWHSHYSLQTYEGVFGPMVIHGPAAADYDEEQFILVQDWNHATVDSLFQQSQVLGIGTGPLTLDTGLINGMNTWGDVGKKWEMTVQSGKSYRLRLVNTAIQSTFVFYVDNHKFTVIAMDFVPIVPYETEKVVINIGQRYDLIMKADQPIGDYWMRGDNQQPCAQLLNPNDIKAMVHYEGGPMGVPTTEQYDYAPTCLDEPYEKLVPIVPLSAGAQSVGLDESILIAPQGGNPNLFKWTLSGTTFYAEWEKPTLKQILEDGTIPDVSGNLAIEVPNLGEWVYVIVESFIPLPHPIHLHGHDFFVLAQGLGPYNPGVALNVNNPPRRDVAVMPTDPTTGTTGYLVIAFETSNPGVWLLHCHIGWVSFFEYYS